MFFVGKVLSRGGLEWVFRGTVNKISVVLVRNTKGWVCQGVGLGSVVGFYSVWYIMWVESWGMSRGALL